MQINSNGTLGTTTSSIKYKENIRDYNDLNNSILNVNPVFFDYKKEFLETDSDDNERYNCFGLIAEHLENVGLKHLLTYNKDNSLQSIRYDLIAVELLSVIKNLNININKLETRIEQLENK